MDMERRQYCCISRIRYPFLVTSAALHFETAEVNTEGHDLKQNYPNPFLETTKIEYYLPAITNNAYIMVCALNGLMIKAIKLEQPGFGNITFERSKLQPGIYFYTLVVNGQIVVTKKLMIK